MRRIAFIIIFTGYASSFVINGQTVKTNTTALLEKLYTRLLVNTDDTERLRINDSIVLIIDSYVRSDTIFHHRFTNLRYLGQIVSPDSQLKIVTWNLLLKNSESRYFCYYILQSGIVNKIFRLTANYSKDPVKTDTTYSEKNWYGALYYDLRQMKKDYKGTWILLGIDYGNPLITRKIIEAVTFTPEGGIVFGKKLFIAGNVVKFREVLEYSHAAVISLRFASDKSIVFDHLVPTSPVLAGNREFYAPDYSYDAFNFDKGMWKLELNTDIRNKK